MKIRFAVVAAASALTALPSWGQANIQVMGNTNITLSGLLAVGIDNSSVSQGNSPSARLGMSSENHVDDNTSRFTISSTSKITDGWNVIFQVGSRFLVTTRPGDFATQGWADDDSWGGISSPYGTLVAGKNNIYYNDGISAGYLSPALEAPGESYRIWDANGLGTFNLLSGVPTSTKNLGFVQSYTTGNGRSRNLIKYDTPIIKLGEGMLMGTLAWSKSISGAQPAYPGNTPSAAYQDNYEAGGTTYAKLRYNGYGFSFLLAYLNQQVAGQAVTAASYTGALNLKGTRAGLSYKAAGLKVGVVYDKTTIDNGISLANAAINAVLGQSDRTVIQVPISYSFGDHAVYATYSKAGNVSHITDSGCKQVNLVYDYALTKRAFAGVFYTKIDNGVNGHYAGFLTSTVFGGSTANPNGVNGEGFRQIGLNLNYWF